MLATTFPNAPISPSNSHSDLKIRSKVPVEENREGGCHVRKEIDKKNPDSEGEGSKKSREHAPLLRSTSEGMAVDTAAALYPFDFILMDIQMPVMGKRD